MKGKRAHFFFYYWAPQKSTSEIRERALFFRASFHAGRPNGRSDSRDGDAERDIVYFPAAIAKQRNDSLCTSLHCVTEE